MMDGYLVVSSAHLVQNEAPASGEKWFDYTTTNVSHQ